MSTPGLARCSWHKCWHLLRERHQLSARHLPVLLLGLLDCMPTFVCCCTPLAIVQGCAFHGSHYLPLSSTCRLGLSLEAALEQASEAPLTPPLLDAWLATERQRQAAQWAPRRAEAAAGGNKREGGEAAAEEEDEEAAARRTVAWRHVHRLLWRFGGCSGCTACATAYAAALVRRDACSRAGQRLARWTACSCVHRWVSTTNAC